MADVFISYSRKDKVFARRLFERLEQDQLEGWADWEGITGGEDWWRKICAAIDAANTFVVIISPDALAGKYCNLEIEQARKSNKRIIPILRREPDEKYLAGEWFRQEWEETARTNYSELTARQYILFRKKPGYDCLYDEVTHEVSNPDCDSAETDADDFETAFQTLLQSVRQDPEYLREHTELLVRARKWEARRGGLLRESELTAAEAWLSGSEGKDPQPTDLHRNYIASSRSATTARRRATVGALTIGLVVTLALSITSLIGFANANFERDRANRRAEEARSLALASGALQQLEAGRPDVAVGLAVEANQNERPSFHVRRALYAASGSRILNRFEGHTGDVNSVAFSPDGQTALSSSSDNTLILWEVGTGEALRTFDGHIGGVYSVAFSPDGQTVLSGAGDGTLILWEVGTGEALRTFDGHTGVVESVAFSPNGQTALSGAGDGTLILWEVGTGEALRTFDGHTGTVYSVVFSPDGQTALSGSCHEAEGGVCSQGELILWEVGMGEVLRRFEGHTDWVSSVAFSPDGQTALSGSWDNTLILWEVATGEALRTFEGHTGVVYSVAFSPDGQTALSGSSSTLILWRVLAAPGSLLHWVENNRYVPELTCEQRALYGVDVQCDESGVFPTRTPFPTLTPSPTRVPRTS